MKLDSTTSTNEDLILNYFLFFPDEDEVNDSGELYAMTDVQIILITTSVTAIVGIGKH